MHFGEFDLYRNLWPSALRMAQSLRLDVVDHAGEIGAREDPDLRCCLMWSLVMNDWLAAPLDRTTVTDQDFNLSLPSEDTIVGPYQCDASGVNPIHFFLMKASMSSILYQFRSALHHSSHDDVSLDVLARQADNELANVISQMPHYLQDAEQEDEGQQAEVESSASLAAQLPSWLKWQRRAVTLLFLYYRMVVHRVVVANAPDHDTATAICLTSAHGIYNVVAALEHPTERQLTW